MMNDDDDGMMAREAQCVVHGVAAAITLLVGVSAHSTTALENGGQGSKAFRSFGCYSARESIRKRRCH